MPRPRKIGEHEKPVIVTLEIGDKTFEKLRALADKKAFETGRRVTVQDVIRELINEALAKIQLPDEYPKEFTADAMETDPLLDIRVREFRNRYAYLADEYKSEVLSYAAYINTLIERKGGEDAARDFILARLREKDSEEARIINRIKEIRDRIGKSIVNELERVKGTVPKGEFMRVLDKFRNVYTMCDDILNFIYRRQAWYYRDIRGERNAV